MGRRMICAAMPVKRIVAAACVLVLALTTPISADTKKGRGTVNKPFIVTWLGEGPTQITVQVKQGKLPLLIVIGTELEDVTWCVSVGHSTRDRIIRCDFNALFDFYALAVGPTAGSANFEVTVTSDAIGESRAAVAVPAGLEDRARATFQRLATMR